jgi:hypothetical protein
MIPPDKLVSNSLHTVANPELHLPKQPELAGYVKEGKHIPSAVDLVPRKQSSKCGVHEKGFSCRPGNIFLLSGTWSARRDNSTPVSLSQLFIWYIVITQKAHCPPHPIIPL